MNFLSLYLHECKFRFFYCFLVFVCNIIAICFEIQPILYHILKPLKSSTIVITDLFEFWSTMILISFFFSFVISFIFFLYNLWAFLSPAFFYRESIVVFNLFLCNSILSLFGIALIIVWILPFMVDLIFYGHQNSLFLVIDCLPKLHSFTLSVIKISFVFFLFLQLPGIFFLLLEYHLITLDQLSQYRKYTYVFFIFVSAFLAPPEIFSQFLILFCLVFVYEFFIFAGFWYGNYIRLQINSSKTVIEN